MPTAKKKAAHRKTGHAAKARKGAKRAAGRSATATINLDIQGEGLSRDGVTRGKLPKAKLQGELEKLIIKLQRVKPGLLGDQRRRLVSSMGCISNPGGPSC